MYHKVGSFDVIRVDGGRLEFENRHLSKETFSEPVPVKAVRDVKPTIDLRLLI